MAGNGLISAGLDIDRTLHFVFYDKILQIYRQHYVKKFYRHITPPAPPARCGLDFMLYVISYYISQAGGGLSSNCQ